MSNAVPSGLRILTVIYYQMYNPIFLKKQLFTSEGESLKYLENKTAINLHLTWATQLFWKKFLREGKTGIDEIHSEVKESKRNGCERQSLNSGITRKWKFSFFHSISMSFGKKFVTPQVTTNMSKLVNNACL